jgi:hypothetical protein
MSAVVGVPVARVSTNSVACYQVYCEQREDRIEQVSEGPASRRPGSLLNATLPESFAARLLDHSLFQRPPPTLSF